MNPMAILHSMRPAQWTKNAVVVAPYIFALGDGTQQIGLDQLGHALIATLLFCLLSSAVYLMNDIRDREHDREHPAKKHRPIAAGELSVSVAATFSVLFFIGAMAGALAINRELAGIFLGYTLLQIVYSFFLKKIALLDIFMIAFGFVLRALAGIMAIRVDISPWLLLCTLLLALFLALCKRRHEKVTLEQVATETRSSMRNYDERLLDQLIAIISSATIVCYAIYTLAPDTVEKFGSARLGFTIPFVLFGIFRYLDLVYRHKAGGSPERILLTDPPTLVNVSLYGVTTLYLILY